MFMPDLARLVNLVRRNSARNSRQPVKRTKWRGLVRNACIALGNSDLRPGSEAYQETLTALRRLSETGDPAISESARWALSRIQSEGNHSSRA
jgi:epoxyqueuosine reductase